MIRKSIKLSEILVDILKNSIANKNFSQKYLLDKVSAPQNCRSFCLSLVGSPGSGTFSHQLFPFLSAGFLLPGLCNSEQWKKRLKASEVIKRDILEIRGPEGAGFLVEVYDKDREEVKKQLDDLMAEFFDKNTAANFTVKCILTVEPHHARGDSLRLAKIHGITTRSEVYELTGKNQFLFVNAPSRVVRVKRMLEKLGYKICNLLFRLEPREKTILENSTLEKCQNFLKAVEQLPKVISVVPNL